MTSARGAMSGRHRSPARLRAAPVRPVRSRVLVPALTVLVVAALVGLAHGAAEGAAGVEPASVGSALVDAAVVSSTPAESLAGARPDPGLDPDPDPDPAPARSAAGSFSRQRAQIAHAASLVGTSLRVVGLGDSVPAGSACGCDSYVTLVARGLAARTRQVAVLHNLAESGITTRDVLAELEDAGLRREVADADLVVLTVGANDLDPGPITDPRCQPDPVTGCYSGALATQRGRLDAVLARLRSLQAAHGGATVVTGYWNVFLDGPAATAHGSTYVRQSNRLTQAVDASIAGVAAARGGRYVDVYTSFKARGSGIARLLSGDGDHPSAAGHRLIAALILAAGA